MCEFAMRPVNITPLVEKTHDLVTFSVQQAVDRTTAWAGIIKSAQGAAAASAPRPATVQTQHHTDPAVRPTSVDGIVDQPQEHSLGGPINAGGDRTAHW